MDYLEEDFREWVQERRDLDLNWPCDGCELHCDRSCPTFKVKDREGDFNVN